MKHLVPDHVMVATDGKTWDVISVVEWDALIDLPHFSPRYPISWYVEMVKV